MIKYYTRACNFNYGFSARQLIKKKKLYPYVEIKIYLSAKLKFLKETKNKVLSKRISLKKITRYQLSKEKRLKKI